MAVSRALSCFIRQRHLLSYTVPTISSKAILCFPFSTSQSSYFSKYSLLSPNKNTSNNNKVQVDYVEVVKDKTTFAWHLSIFVVGLTGAAVICYFIFQELFSSNSPNYVYSKAYNNVINDPRIIEVFGAPIKAYGEETSKRRRGHVKSLVYLRNEIEHMKMKFYIQGVHYKGDVHLEVRKNSEGYWDYRYLFVELKNKQKTVIVLQDNREIENKEYHIATDSEELMPPDLSEIVAK